MSEYTNGLRMLADFLDDNPDIKEPVGKSSWDKIIWHMPSKGHAAELVRALPVSVDKRFDETYLNLEFQFDGLYMNAFIARDSVCEKVVTGTETLIRLVPPEGVEMIEEEYERDIIEWKCSEPLLAT